MLIRCTTVSAGQKHEDAEVVVRHVEGVERCAREREVGGFEKEN
jgi:hypothetical protein